ncbi:hypothetical protein QE380_000159 [Acinetobacter baylyi]|uniref:Uncharacterized protein n=1 Tax=Acinetobacter baylyi TaxID=202950 RepID=A0ABU0URZ7_ACIBI|nr:hypothetical protein [Acinetobacter baylyi]MDQ1207236.1 hypothetical protein [Acinetobacter baylyi]MDR6105683.1 hypothetical protein [Acinetobacter baylyi]MDR6187597.1 hypothetical protein [Acinetobacter baylyi]
MGFLFNTDFLEQFGYSVGEEDEATHYSTYGECDWKLKANKDQVFFWDALSRSWKKWALTLGHCTPIGEQEPNFRCGPVNQVAVKAVVKATELAPIYTDSRYKGD